MAGGPRYTAREDEIIKAYYPEEGHEVRSRLPQRRSIKSVEYRAAHLGVQVADAKRFFRAVWTEGEMNSMKILYGQIGPDGMFKVLKGRFTVEAIRHKGRRMRLSEGTPPPKAENMPELPPIDIDEQDTAPMIQRHIPEGEWKRDHPIPRRSVFDVEARA